MTNLERFWHDLMQARLHIINEVYGNEAMLRYRPHPKEKEFFLANNGRMTYDEDVADYTHRFWRFCEERYQHEKKLYQDRLKENWERSTSMPAYKQSQQDRDELKKKIREVILGHAKEKHQDRQQSQQATE